MIREIYNNPIQKHSLGRAGSKPIFARLSTSGVCKCAVQVKSNLVFRSFLETVDAVNCSCLYGLLQISAQPSAEICTGPKATSIRMYINIRTCVHTRIRMFTL